MPCPAQPDTAGLQIIPHKANEVPAIINQLHISLVSVVLAAFTSGRAEIFPGHNRAFMQTSDDYLLIVLFSITSDYPIDLHISSLI